MTWGNIRFWLAIVLLVDSAVGLWGFSRLEALVPGVPVRRLALVEAGLGLLLLARHFWGGEGLARSITSACKRRKAGEYRIRPSCQ